MMQHEYTVYIDDLDIGFYGMRLSSYEIPSYAKRKNVGTDIPGAHGTQSAPSALASGTFTATVVCEGDSVEAVNQQIREFFAFMYSTLSPHKIVFSDDAGIVRHAILDSPNNYRVIDGVDNAFAEIKLTFFMMDPFMYNNELSVFMSTVSSGVETILRNEAFECPAVFALENNGSQAVSGLALIVNNELSTFSCVLEPGDVLELDTVEYEVRLNGVVNLELWRGEMPKLKNGLNSIYQRNTLQKNLKLTVSFTKQWI